MFGNVCAIWLCIISLGVSANAEVPSSPKEIAPILMGASPPSVEVARVDGSVVDLADVVSGQPTILIFYRGGW